MLVFFRLASRKEDRLSHGLPKREKEKSVTAELEVTRGIILPFPVLLPASLSSQLSKLYKRRVFEFR